MNKILKLLRLPKSALAFSIIKSSGCQKEIFEDLRRIGTPENIDSFIDCLYSNNCFPNILNQRMRQASHLKPIILRILFPLKKDMEINDCTIGGGFCCYHGHGTVICADRIGRNFSVWQGVTIGKNGSNDCPKIGDNVKVLTNAVVAGSIRIGDNAEIGAGAIVLKDVPDNCVVVGNPARIIRENGVKVNRPL